MASSKVMLKVPFPALFGMNLVCFTSVLLSHLHPNCLLKNTSYNLASKCHLQFLLYIVPVYFSIVSFTTLRGRRQLLDSFPENSQAKKHKAIILLISTSAIATDLYKSWNDFNIFSMIALHCPSVFSINFIYSAVGMLETCSLEIERLNRRYRQTRRNESLAKNYHKTHEALSNLSHTFGPSLLENLLVSASMGLLFCYTHCLDLVRRYRGKEVLVPTTFAPDFWTVAFMTATFSVFRAAHKLEVRAEETRRLANDEMQRWQLNYERMEVSAWGFFNIGNHIFISTFWEILLYVLVLFQMDQQVWF